MIIRTSKKLVRDLDPFNRSGIIEVKAEKDKLVFLHGQEVTPVLAKAHDIREHSDNGWTEGRHFMQIGHIPSIEFAKHPEWMHEPKLMIKWLNSDEGQPYRTVRGRV